MKKKQLSSLLVLTAMGATTAFMAVGCSSGDSGSADGTVNLNYALWDDKQLPAYQSCVDAFVKENPGISVKVTQTAWDQYWTNLTTELSSGTAPDVFTNHVSRYPELAANNQLLDLQPAVDAAKVDMGQYRAGLAENWVKDGKRYALPKDFDTIALAYDSQKLKDANIDPASLNDLSWNPKDGGTFEQVIAELTLDKNGNNGLSADFDKKNIKTYGLLAYEPGDGFGQTWWGNFAASNGFTYTEKNPFGTQYHYDSPELADTLTWFRSVVEKGYMLPPEKLGKLGPVQLLSSGQVAMNTNGSWQMNAFTEANKDIKFAKLPVGPEGRKSLLNGLGDSVYAGTKHPEQAEKLALYLVSPECQNAVASKAVVFPAITEADATAVEAFKNKSTTPIDPSAFIETADEKNGTVLYPITEHATEVNKIAGDAIDAIIRGTKQAQPALAEAQQQINSLFGK
ncbi:multiple sugar transport system substrate-binding protein [Arthrobacter sp. UYCu511]|uniref:ABC transporter substrate-binding protein n=1 Tax=unclassified Arthrobacter TaxID=235627 RepID=UPI0028F71249|nr:sugar ABC transporter substrate-binding protein [Arthrobacter sp. lap29]